MPKSPKYSEVQSRSLEVVAVRASSAERTSLLLPVQRGSDLPFAPESTAGYGTLPKNSQRAVAKRIASAKDAGLSGDEMRAVFGALLSGPARRKVLRDYGIADGRIAPSYVEYIDGDARIGTRHAREHGAEALARREAEAAKAAKSAKRKEAAAARKAAKAAAAADAAAPSTDA